MKNIWIFLIGIIALSGCSNGSNSSGGSNPTTSPIVTGQWEFVFDNSSTFVEVNLADNGPGVASGTGAVALEQGFFSSFSAGAIGTGMCGLPSQNAIDGSNSANIFNGTIDVGNNEDDTLTGILAANDASISQGTVTGGAVFCGQSSAPSTFTASVVPPINGTFAGTLNSSEGFQDQVNILVSENSSQQITMSGTVVGNGVSTTVAVPSSNPGQTVGALINSTGTATNAQGTYSFQFLAHFNAATSQLFVKTYNSTTGESLTGYLSKQ
jgi:hypothetical protein